MKLPWLAGGACRRAGVLLLLFLAGACAHVAPTHEDFQCGPEALAMAMRHAGVVLTPHEITAHVYVPARKGSFQVEMLAAPRRHGLVTQVLGSRDELLLAVASGTPVVVLQRVGSAPRADWHYAVALGFDHSRDRWMLRSGERRVEMSSEAFEESWSPGGRWAMIVTSPGTIPAATTASRHLAAIHAMARVSDARAAAGAYEAFLHRWPGSLGATLGLGNAWHALGRLDLAEAVLRSAHGTHPGATALINNLAQTLSDQGRHEEAWALIDKALGPDDFLAEAMRGTRALILARMAARRSPTGSPRLVASGRGP